MNNIVIATVKNWNIENARKFRSECKNYNVIIIMDKDWLGEVHQYNPRYIFFPHWSWKIPKDIYDKFECVAFHMADLPYGRGGSPLQNLILRKIYKTKISAFKVDDGIDTGPIYMKVPFWLGEGSAGELYRKASEIIFQKMIPEILEKQMKPVPQEGEVLEFKRRLPCDSEISCAHLESDDDENTYYDFIRMLDSEGYPKAFWEPTPEMRFYFSNIRRSENGNFKGEFEIVLYD